jgi:hypothetical protein
MRKVKRKSERALLHIRARATRRDVERLQELCARWELGASATIRRLIAQACEREGILE